MKTACITLSTPTPEMFAYVSIEVPESIGDVSFFSQVKRYRPLKAPNFISMTPSLVGKTEPS
jgi:hypothetical protein